MLLNYSPVERTVRRLGPALLSAAVAAASAAGSAWYFVRAARMSAALATAANQWCGTSASIETARVRSAGMAPANATSVAVLLAGLTVVAGVQAIRFYHGSVARGSPRAA